MKCQTPSSTVTTARELPRISWDGSTITGLSRTTYPELEPGRYLLKDSGVRFRVEPFKSSIPLIIDEFKTVFGLPKIGRHKVGYLDGTYVLITREMGFEHSALADTVSLDTLIEYDIYKTRLFRWLLGLTSKFVSNDMIVRNYNGISEIISWNDTGIDFLRKIPSFVSSIASKWDPNDTLKEMLYGHTVNSLVDVLSEIVLRIDPSMIYYPGQIVERLSLYGFLEADSPKD